MATLAAMFGRAEAAALAQAAAPALPDPEAGAFALRAFPNEDVYFFAKKIDNGRLVRQADPQGRRKCWKALGGATLGVLALMALLLPHVLGVVTGYQLHNLEQQNATLENQKAALELEEARLVSPQRMEELARSMQFVDPAPEQIVFLNPKAEGALALNVPAK